VKALREDVAAAWKTFEALDEREMAKAATSGATRSLEQLDGQSPFCWPGRDFTRRSARHPPPNTTNA